MVGEFALSIVSLTLVGFLLPSNCQVHFDSEDGYHSGNWDVSQMSPTILFGSTTELYLDDHTRFGGEGG